MLALPPLPAEAQSAVSQRGEAEEEGRGGGRGARGWKVRADLDRLRADFSGIGLRHHAPCSSLLCDRERAAARRNPMK